MEPIDRIRQLMAEDAKQPGRREWIAAPASDVLAACDAVTNPDAKIAGLRAFVASKKAVAEALVRKSDLQHLLDVAG